MKAPPTTLRVRVTPGAARPGVVGRHGDGWKVRVAAPPERGKANDAVLRLIAGALGVSRRDLTLASGQTSRDKVVTLVGVPPDLADARMAAAAGGPR